ncbi:hypothetical protein Tco_0017771 [Tanacetum coccineum]
MNQHAHNHGEEINKKRPLVISVLRNGQWVPLYVRLFNLAPQVKHAHVEAHFARVTADQPVAYLPMKQVRKGGLISKGFGFLYLKSLADFEAAFGCDQSDICNKVITVEPGGLKLVAVFESRRMLEAICH